MVQNGVVIVTGCAGFIGSHVSEALLKEGTTVIGIDILSDYYDLKIKHENLRILRATSRKSRGTPGAEGNGEFIFYEADICNRKEMDKIFQKAKKLGGAQEGIKVCHLAARAGVRPSLENPEGYVQTNVEGTVILLDLARIHQAKNFVYASSSSVYGANQKVPFSEKDPVDSPVSPYAATKRACELMASTFHTLYNLPVTGLRFFTVYGPRGRPDMAPFKFVHRISNGLPIDRFGDGTSARDYTFIDDIVSGVLGAIHNPQPCEVINLGNSQVISLNDFISVIETCVGKKAIIRQLPEQPGDVPLTYADCEKASRLLGYKPSNSIRQGMEKFVKWYNEFNSTTPSDQPSQKTAKPLIKRPTITGDEIESPSSDLEISSEDFD